MGASESTPSAPLPSAKQTNYPQECPMHQENQSVSSECPMNKNSDAINPANMVDCSEYSNNSKQGFLVGSGRGSCVLMIPVFCAL